MSEPGSRKSNWKFRVTPGGRELIRGEDGPARALQNMAAYLRKMALDGYGRLSGTAGTSGDGIPAAPGSNNLNQLTGASMRQGASMMPIWKICGRDRKSCGRRQNQITLGIGGP